MRKFWMVIFTMFVLSIGSVSAAQGPTVLPSSPDSGSYIRDMMVLEEVYSGEADILMLSDEVARLAGEVAVYQPMSEGRAKQIIDLGKKVEETEKKVQAASAEAKKAARSVNPKSMEPRGLAEDTWKKVKKTAEDVVVASAKADKKDLDKLREETRQQVDEIRNWRAKIDEDLKKIRTEIEALKAEDKRLAAEDAKIREENAQAKAEQAKTDGRQDEEIRGLQANDAAQDITDKRQQEETAKVKQELASKAEMALVTGGIGSMAVISLNDHADVREDVRMYALTLRGEYIIRKEWLRVGLGGAVGASFKEFGEYASARFYFDSRIRAGYCWNFVAGKETPAQFTLSPYGHTYSSGMPYSEQFGLGGGLSLQFDFHITDTLDGLRFTLEFYGGYARDWHKVKVDPPADGGFYKKTREDPSNVLPLGINLGLTF